MGKILALLALALVVGIIIALRRNRRLEKDSQNKH